MENTMMKDDELPQVMLLMDAEALIGAIERLEAAIREFRRACAAAEDEPDEGSEILSQNETNLR